MFMYLWKNWDLIEILSLELVFGFKLILAYCTHFICYNCVLSIVLIKIYLSIAMRLIPKCNRKIDR